MKKLIAACITTLTLAVLPNIALAVPVTDDLWDVNQGTVVTASSPIYPGSSANNMFGASEGSTEYGLGRTLFADWFPDGTEHWVQWQTAATVTLGSFKLYAFHDGSDNGYGRAFDHFSLLKNNAGNWEEVYGTSVAVPYTYINSGEYLLIEYTLPAAITAQEFKAVFRQHGYVPYASGPRVIELDGFVPEPATVALLGFGSLVLIRRKRKA